MNGEEKDIGDVSTILRVHVTAVMQAVSQGHVLRIMTVGITFPNSSVLYNLYITFI